MAVICYSTKQQVACCTTSLGLPKFTMGRVAVLDPRDDRFFGSLRWLHLYSYGEAFLLMFVILLSGGLAQPMCRPGRAHSKMLASCRRPATYIAAIQAVV
jgi:hypothetical protein